MGSSVLDGLGRMHIVSGSVSASGTAALTTNDGSATLTDNGTGDFTVTFGDAFVAAPVVVACPVDATFSTDAAVGVAVKVIATNSVQFNCWEADVEGATATDITNAAADISFQFIAVGYRDN